MLCKMSVLLSRARIRYAVPHTALALGASLQSESKSAAGGRGGAPLMNNVLA